MSGSVTFCTISCLVVSDVQCTDILSQPDLLIILNFLTPILSFTEFSSLRSLLATLLFPAAVPPSRVTLNCPINTNSLVEKCESCRSPIRQIYNIICMSEILKNSIKIRINITEPNNDHLFPIQYIPFRYTPIFEKSPLAMIM